MDLPDGERDEFVMRVRKDWRTAERWMSAADQALCAYAVKLTQSPGRMTEADVQALREAGLDDVSIHDAIQVVGYFNYINRIADGVDVELEPEYPRHPRAD